MISICRIKSCIQGWSLGAALAAAGAAVVGTAGLAVAHADDGAATDIGLLTTGQTDATEAFAALHQLAGGSVPADFSGLIDRVEDVQIPLLSSDNTLVSGVGELLFNSPDQQLAQSAEAFLTAAQTYVADPASLTNAFAALSTSFQFDGALIDLDPSADIGKIIEQVLDISSTDSASAGAATDLAISASAANSPDGVLGEAITVLNQGSSVLATASTADLSTRAADLVSNQEALVTQLDTGLTGSASLQDMLSAGDQTLVADVDEQFVSAAQNLLTADQGFVAADQAGELSSSGINAPELGVIGADLQLLVADFDTTGATILAALTGGLDVSSTADLASTLDPATMVDPSIFADPLSSIGF